MWIGAATDAGVPTERAVGALYVTRSLALIAQPFLLSALLGATESAAVTIIGVLCVACAGLFFATTRRTALAPEGVRRS